MAVGALSAGVTLQRLAARRADHGAAAGVVLPPAALLTDAAQGTRLYVLYDLDEMLHHERLLCAPVDGWSWEALTPSLGQHEEDFGEALEVYRCGAKRGIPREL